MIQSPTSIILRIHKNNVRVSFVKEILQALPSSWVTSFKAYEALEVLGIDEICIYTLFHLKEKDQKAIIKVCIKYILPDKEYYRYYNTGDNPISILSILFGTHFKCKNCIQKYIKDDNSIKNPFKFLEAKIETQRKCQICRKNRKAIPMTRELLKLTLKSHNPRQILIFFWKDLEVEKWKKEIISKFGELWQKQLRKTTNIFDAIFDSKAFDDPAILIPLSEALISN